MLSPWHQERLADLVWLYGRIPKPLAR